MSNSTSNDKLGHDPLEWLEAVTEESERGQIEPVEISTTPDDKTDDNTEEQCTTSPSNTALVLPEDLTVRYVEELHTAWREQFSSMSDSLAIDASQLSQIDSCGYQLLISLLKQAAERNVSCHLTQLSEGVREQLVLIGDKQLQALHDTGHDGTGL